MKLVRTGSASWQGSTKDGKGAISTQSGALESYPYGFTSRFDGVAGTNPEELLGAAHAGCFTMAFTLRLGHDRLVATRIETTAEVTLESTDSGYSITAVHLRMSAVVPGADKATFDRLATDAKETCPLSKLMNARITLEAELLDI